MKSRATVAELCQQIIEAIRLAGDVREHRAQWLLIYARRMLRYIRESEVDHRGTRHPASKEVCV